MTAQVKSLVRLTTHLHNIDPEMTVSRLMIFLHVAAANEGQPKDILVRDLIKRVGVGQSTVARTLSILADKPQRGKKDGLRWVETYDDPEDVRRKRVRLTQLGQKVLADIETFSV